MKVRILTIDGCGNCSRVKQFLKESNVDYSETPCESNPKACDEVENITYCKNYPMVILENEYTGKKEFVYPETRFERLRPTIMVSEKVVLIPKDSIDGVVAWIKNRLNS